MRAQYASVACELILRRQFPELTHEDINYVAQSVKEFSDERSS